MTAAELTIIAGLVIAWCLVGARAGRAGLSGPMVFLASGVALDQVGVVDLTLNSSALQLIVEGTLVLSLFSDASTADLRQLGRHGGWAARMLLLGLPLSIVIGSGAAVLVLPELGWSAAVLLAASLAATDASLSATVLSDRRVPERVRLALNLESGLNDGLATPIVLLAITAVATTLGLDRSGHAEETVIIDLLGGAALGLVVGGAAGWLIERAHRSGWMEPGARRIATLAIPIGLFAAAEVWGFSMFIAAFVGGLAFGQVHRQERSDLAELPEYAAEAMAWVTWFLFGAILLVPALELVDLRVAVYAALSLTVVRMVPVAVSLVRSGADRPTVAFLGWFGPRGLATVVFGLLIVDDLGLTDPTTKLLISALCATVVASIVAHGVTAFPLTAWIGAAARRQGAQGTGADASSP